ncbi:sensor histidine kinase [Chitinophaga solisilvae]|uniref:sensor histidine kinase n=1 Tax=Chitinophaga solisilvae TaxID=1233460 RepID=UPI0013689ACB|nr:HAMP domain-containing sensor histidine kinase [Chitinophaga solisilvae]
MTDHLPYLRKLALCWLLALPVFIRAQSSGIEKLKKQLPLVTDSVAYVTTLNRLAIAYQACQLDSCGKYASLARDVATRIHDRQGRAHALRNLGSYYAFRPHRYLSFLFYNDALNESRAAGDSCHVSQVLMNIGIYYNFNGNAKDARSMINRALLLTWQLKADSLRAMVLANYYTVYYADSLMKPYAAKALLQAGILAEQFRDVRASLTIQLLQANETFMNGRFSQAETDLKHIIDTAARAGLNYLAMYGSMQLTGYKVWLRQADSLEYRQKSVKYAMAGGYIGLILPAVTILYNHYQRRGDTLQAARYSRIALRIMQQQQDDMQKGEMDYIAYTMQDQTMDSLKLQAVIQESALQKSRLQQRFWQYLLVFMIVVILLVLLLFFKFLRSYHASGIRAQRLSRLQQEVSDSNETLRVNDDFKNKLISLIAHDFRTPLHNIIDITGFVNESVLTPEDATEMVIEVERTATNTLTVFEEILSWMRTQLSGFVYYPKPYLLQNMLTAMIQSLHHLVKDKQLLIIQQLPPGLQVHCDYEMLQFIHRNFLHNAIKFSPAGSTITITAIRINTFTEISFSDEGPGVPAEVLPWLFAYDSHSYRQKRTGKGAGLALIICKDFIDKMKGEIGAVNNPVKGSTFYYRLPEAPGEEENIVS